MAGTVSHIHATQVRKRRAIEQSGTPRDFKQLGDPLACTSSRQAQHRRKTLCRQAKPHAHPKDPRTNPNLHQKNWMKTRDAIRRHGLATVSAGMLNNWYLFPLLEIKSPSMEI